MYLIPFLIEIRKFIVRILIRIIIFKKCILSENRN